MKSRLELLFIFFYVMSTYVVGEIRTADTVRQLQFAIHLSNAPGFSAVFSRNYDDLPRHREAKAASNDFQSQSFWNLNLMLTEAAIFLEHEGTQRLDFRLPVFHSRAPPPQPRLI
jgi:hypothetical protein